MRLCRLFFKEKRKKKQREEIREFLEEKSFHKIELSKNMDKQILFLPQSEFDCIESLNFS